MIQGSVSKGWLYKNGGFVFPESYYLDPLARLETDRRISSFLADRFPKYPVYNMESNLVQAEHAVPDMVYVGGIQPNLILGVLLGAEFIFPEGADADITVSPLRGLSSAGDLPSPDELISHPLLRRFQEQARELTERGLTVIPPYFWDLSGRATIHGFITTAYKLVGEEVFIRMFEDPEFLLELHRWITEAYTALIRYCAGLTGLEVTSLHIGECSGAMLSDRDFERFIRPFADDMGRSFGSVRFHSCGQSDHLLESITAITGIESVDTGSGTSVSRLRELGGPDLLIEVAPPVELLLSQADPEEMRRWADTVLEENRGGSIRFGYHLEPGYNLECVFALHDRLAERGLPAKGRRPL